MKNTITHPSVLNEKLVEAIKDLRRYDTDILYREEGERRAKEATDGNITFKEVLEKSVTDAADNAKAEADFLLKIMAVDPEYYVAKQFQNLDPQEMRLYLKAQGVNYGSVTAIINAYDEIRAGKRNTVDFLKSL